MRDLGIDVATLAPWFVSNHDSPYVLFVVSDEHAHSWADILSGPVGRCYIDDSLFNQRTQATGRSKQEILPAKLPNRGSTMAGDFGEILVFLYHATLEPGVELIGPKKWRLK